MPSIFHRIAEVRRRRKRIKEALYRNETEFEKILSQIHQEYSNEKADIMNEYVHNILQIGDLDAERAEELTEEAELKCKELDTLEASKIEEAKRLNERHIERILSCYR